MSPEVSLVRWPQIHRPEGASIYVRNEVVAPVAIEAAWAWLIRAVHWPDWYANCRKLSFDANDGPDLQLGTHFRWTTFHVPVRTVVEEFEPPTRLAWSGGALGSMGYHAWYLEVRDDGQCWIVTEETQRGLIPSLGKRILRPQMLHWHQRWLEGLAAQAQLGVPPQSIKNGSVPG